MNTRARFQLRYFILIPMLLALAGWTKKDLIASQQKPSAAVRQMMVQASKNEFVDPYSVRDAEISSIVTMDPKKKLDAVCIRANAKNRMGAYAGKVTFSVRIQNGRVASVNYQARGCQLPELRYYPFQELEALN